MRQPSEVLAYWPQRRLQDAIYGSVWACLVLKRHHGVAADDAARAAGVEPGSASAPIVWEITGQHVAIQHTPCCCGGMSINQRAWQTTLFIH